MRQNAKNYLFINTLYKGCLHETRLSRSIKNVNKPERVIEKSMLQATMQGFIESILR